MSEKQAWSSADLVSRHPDLLHELYTAGLGRKNLAKAVTQRTGVHCSEGTMCRALQALDLNGRSPGSGAATSSAVLKTYVANTGSGAAPMSISDVSDDDPSDGDIPIDDLIKQRIDAARRKHIRSSAHKRTLELDAKPIGLMVFGDPHVDNEGCDWKQLMDHVDLVNNTPGVLAASVGDMTDNWIGRLQRLYANASMLASDGWRLSEWLLEAMPWVAIVGGNHDQWAHAPGVDPLQWISKKAKVMCFANDEIRITFRWKKRPDLAPVIWVLRHDFGGRSWFHPTHGPHKEAMLDGKCHVLTSGHIHQWGQLTTEQRHERVTHALRVRGYKRDDAHAKALGFSEQQHGAAALIVIDPEADEPGRVRVFWDLEHGCDYLTWLRNR